MKLIVKKYNFVFKIISIILVTVLAFLLRYQNFDKVPFPGESMDEYSYTWVGMSLIKIGVPVGVSGIDGYKNTISEYINVDHVYQTTANGNPLTINWPWFDHPPLLGLLTGGFAISKGAINFSDTSIYIIRKPMLILGTISVALLILIGWNIFNFNVGLLAGLFYAFSPVSVVGSRMIQGENGMIPFFLASLLFITLFIKYKYFNLLIFGAIFAGISCLFKLSGGVTILIGILLLWSKNRDSIFKFIIISCSIASLFLLYGLSLGFADFLSIFVSNGSRYYGIGPEAIFNLLTQVKITNRKFLTDPLILAGWMSLFSILAKKKFVLGDKVLVISTISYLVIYLVLGSYAHGWYAFPFFPFLMLAFASLANSGFGIIMILMIIGYQITKFIGIDQFQIHAYYWRYMIGILLIWVLTSKYIFLNNTTKTVNKILIMFLLIIVVFLNYRYLQTLTVDNWYKVF